MPLTVRQHATIYQAIGYQPVCDVDQYQFAADA